MRCLIFVFAIAGLTSGCFGGGGGVKTIISSPNNALVTITGYGNCTTPCSIEVDVPREITVAKAGYLPRRFTLSSASPNEIEIELPLAAPSSDVSTTSLPEIN